MLVRFCSVLVLWQLGFLLTGSPTVAEDLYAPLISDKAPAPAEMDPARKISTLAPVTVVGQPEDFLTGSSSIEPQVLDQLPKKNGSINEAIGILPGVQLSEQARSSLTAGEILPPLLSISGGKAYQNNFIIDGVSNNSVLSPLADNPINIQGVPDHPQLLYLDTRLIERVDVYRYNIPVSYGNFSGGVVDVQTRNPEPDFYGELSYRTTQDAWTETILDDQMADEFKASSDAKLQPRFEKHFGGILLNTPLTDRFSLLTAYQLSYSEIELQQLGATKTQRRRNENLLAKLAFTPDSSSRLTASLQYSPYKGDYFYADAREADYFIRGGGLQFSSVYERNFALGDLTLTAAWGKSKNERDAASFLKPWLAQIDSDPDTLVIEAVPSSRAWGLAVDSTSSGMPASYEGSLGSLTSEQQGLQFKADFLAHPVTRATSSQTINIGVALERLRGSMERHDPYYIYLLDTKNVDIDDDPDTPKEKLVINDDYPDLVCPVGSTDCVDGEQLFLKRMKYPQDSVSTDIDLLDFYLENRIEWRKLTIRPGIRISYDDFMENTNLAPRLAASYDLFGNNHTVLLGGWNRYYGRTLLAYKLREATRPWFYQTREVVQDEFDNDRPGEWLDGFQLTTAYRYSRLDTPYSDETMLGLDQSLWQGRLKLVWLQRKGRDQFSQEKTGQQPDGYKYYQLTNHGESRHDEYSLEWERSWSRHYVGFNVTYQESTATNESYAESFDAEDAEEIVWFEGKLVHRDELARDDFNQPWIANLTYTARLPWNVSFTNVTTYRSGFEGLVALTPAAKSARGIETRYAYQTEDLPEAWVFDWVLEWQKRLTGNQAVTVSLEVNNVFNRKIKSGTPSDPHKPDYQTYEIGRQFWLGMRYSF